MYNMNIEPNIYFKNLFNLNQDQINEIHCSLDFALKNGAQEAEIFCEYYKNKNLNYNNNSIDIGYEDICKNYCIRVISNNSIAYSNTTNESNMKKDILKLIKLTKLTPKIEYSFSNKKKYKFISGIYDPSIESITYKDLIEFSKDNITNLENNIHIISYDLFSETQGIYIVNTNGLKGSFLKTLFSSNADVIAENSKSKATASIYKCSHTLTNKDNIINTISESSKLAKKSLCGRKIGLQKCSVIFSSRAISELLKYCFLPSIYGNNIHYKKSIFFDRLNSKVCSDDLTISDNGSLKDGIFSRPFDDEGEQTQNTKIIENGYFKIPLYNKEISSFNNNISTGNGFQIDGGAISIHSTNIIINYPSFDLIKETKNGIYVSDIIGAHTSNSVTGDFSVEGQNSFKIENGNIKYPIKSLNISGNIFNMLKEKISGASVKIHDCNGSLTNCDLKFENINIVS